MKTLHDIDFDDFHATELPSRLAEGNGPLAASTTKPGRSFAWHLTDGRAVTYTITEDGLEITPGDLDAEVVVEIPPDDWAMYAQEMKSCFALLYTDAIRMWKGEFDNFAAWEPTLLAAYFGRPVYARSPKLLDLQGRRLDLQQSFTLDDDPEEIANFFQTAGFLHLREVYTPGEVEAYRAIVSEAMENAAPDDEKSWWATKRDGSQVCCRVTYMNERYPMIRALRDDERLQRIADFSGEELLPNCDRLDGYSVVVKHGRIVEGLSDLPWHRDCGMGGHPVLCPGVNIGIQLDEANEKTGQLHFLAGSHHHSNHGMKMRKTWPTAAIDTKPGDVTAHFGHTLHGAPAPRVVNRGRRVLYAGFKQAILDEFVPEGQGYNDVLFKHDSGRVRSPDEVQAARKDKEENYFEKGSYDPYDESDYGGEKFEDWPGKKEKLGIIRGY